MIKTQTIKFKLLNKLAKLPNYDHDDDAGFSIFTTEDKILKKGEIYSFETGIASEIPKDYFVSIRDRSSMGVKGIRVLGGVIDAGYRGEWHVIMTNLGEKEYEVKTGDKIAQGILQEARQAKIVEVKSINGTKRGKKGFGSTGR